MKVAIVADTPYQVMNAINLKICNSLFCNECVDLYIGHQFKDSKMISYLVKKKELFANVYDFYPSLLGEKDNIVFRILKVVFHERNLHRLLNGAGNYNFKNKYDIILFSILTEMSKMLLLCNDNAEVYMFDDGIGSYSRNFKPTSSVSRGHLFLYRLLGYNIANPGIVKGIFLNNPSFYAGSEFDNILHIKDNDSDSTKILKDVFKVSNSEQYLKNKIIYLTYPDNEKDCIVCNNIANNLNGVLIRLHPRQNAKSCQLYNGVKDYGEGLWELICSSYIFDDHILISAYSTAQLTPFMLFGKQPYLVFTYKLFGDYITDELKDAIEKMIEMIKEKYSDKNRICIASSEREIFEFLAKVKSKIVLSVI